MGKDEYAKYMGSLGLSKYSMSYYNDRYMSSYVRYLSKPIELQRLYYVKVASSSIKNVPFWLVILIIGSGGSVRVRAGVYGKSLYLPLNFVVNLKLV